MIIRVILIITEVKVEVEAKVEVRTGRNNKHTPYDKSKRQDHKENQPKANLTGKSLEVKETNNKISFITEHLTKKGVY